MQPLKRKRRNPGYTTNEEFGCEHIGWDIDEQSGQRRIGGHYALMMTVWSQGLVAFDLAPKQKIGGWTPMKTARLVSGGGLTLGVCPKQNDTPRIHVCFKSPWVAEPIIFGYYLLF
jgi:hypothetical protein